MSAEQRMVRNVSAAVIVVLDGLVAEEV